MFSRHLLPVFELAHVVCKVVKTSKSVSQFSNSFTLKFVFLRLPSTSSSHNCEEHGPCENIAYVAVLPLYTAANSHIPSLGLVLPECVSAAGIHASRIAF